MLKFLFFLLIYIISTTKSFSAEKIVYLDLDYLLSNSNKGKQILLNLENIKKENIDIFKQKEDAISKEEKKLIQQKNILSQEIYSEKINILKKEIEKYRSEKKELVGNFNKQKDENINNLLKLIDSILAEYVKENSIDLVLNKKDILMGKNNYNITNDIMVLINNSDK